MFTLYESIVQKSEFVTSVQQHRSLTTSPLFWLLSLIFVALYSMINQTNQKYLQIVEAMQHSGAT